MRRAAEQHGIRLDGLRRESVLGGLIDEYEQAASHANYLST
jgi:hypothetical protein